MISLGIMTLNNTSERTYINEIAKRANANGMNCYRFIPTDIHPGSKHIKGEFYNKDADRWESSTFLLPELVYDRCYYQEDFHSKQCQAIVNWMKQSGKTIFLGMGLPNKLEIYRTLKQSSLSPYLPKSEPFTSAKSFIAQLKTDKQLVLKPINGSQGKGIYVVQLLNDNLIISTDKQEKHISQTMSVKSATNWLTKLTRKYQYFIQPLLYLKNENNQPFDLRIFLQKDEKGVWNELSRGMRTGKTDGIISNLSAGGSITSFTEWVNTLPSKQRAFLKEELEDILSKLPDLLESIFPPLFEIGIDIGIENNGAIWILDINSKPGRKMVLETKPELAEQLYLAPILFGKHLLSANTFERK
ncbi:YheC/YheD family protein [Cytobacillus horneckiae]|uniref:YheC/YheD family endospore coat-associated protein n=1 Tax=Cytobacillus horneckiae TaxID=549687 RepID=UPI0034CF5888